MPPFRNPLRSPRKAKSKVPVDQKEKGLIKIVVGIALAILGLFGLTQSPKIKHRGLRFAGFTASGLAIASGVYLFVLGVNDVALARVGTSALGKAEAEAIVYENPDDFKDGLLSTFASNPDWFQKVRRLQFVCPDKSESFRVFNTALGPIGIPEGDVKCNDGSFLLRYSSK